MCRVLSPLGTEQMRLEGAGDMDVRHQGSRRARWPQGQRPHRCQHISVARLPSAPVRCPEREDEPFVTGEGTRAVQVRPAPGSPLLPCGVSLTKGLHIRLLQN